MTTEAVGTATLLPSRADLSGARRRLFETALLLFADRGYHAVSVRDLAAELGQQPGALYFHVPSKQQLLYELVVIGFEEHRDLLRAALLDAGSEPTQQIRAMAEAHVRLHLDYQSLARLIARETRALTEEQLGTVLQIRAEVERMLIDVIERGVRLDELIAPDPFLAVKAITAMGIRVAEWWGPDAERSADEITDAYAEFAVRMLT